MNIITHLLGPLGPRCLSTTLGSWACARPVLGIGLMLRSRGLRGVLLQKAQVFEGIGPTSRLGLRHHNLGRNCRLGPLLLSLFGCPSGLLGPPLLSLFGLARLTL